MKKQPEYKKFKELKDSRWEEEEMDLRKADPRLSDPRVRAFAAKTKAELFRRCEAMRDGFR